jgi:hypothetical protein
MNYTFLKNATLLVVRGTQWRNCATSRKDAVSISHVVTEIYFTYVVLAAALCLWDCKRNGYQEYFLGDKGGRCVGMTTAPHSCAECLEIWGPRPSGTLRASSGLYMGCFNFLLVSIEVLYFPCRLHCSSSSQPRFIYDLC